MRGSAATRNSTACSWRRRAGRLATTSGTASGPRREPPCHVLAALADERLMDRWRRGGAAWASRSTGTCVRGTPGSRADRVRTPVENLWIDLADAEFAATLPGTTVRGP